MFILCWASYILIALILLRTVLSWSRFRHGSGGERFAGFIFWVTDPIFWPLRKIIPSLRVGSVGLDFSPMIVLFVLFFVQKYVC